jgi:hypothetical protein
MTTRARTEKACTQLTVSIAANTCESEVIDFRRYSNMLLHMPAAWTAANIGFKVSTTKTGTFIPLYQDATLIQVQNCTVSLAFVAPSQVAYGRYVRLWSQSSGSDVDQGADRSILLELSS